MPVDVGDEANPSMGRQFVTQQGKILILARKFLIGMVFIRK
jgi:hypothetical protein